ncbi:MAG: FIST C-terminal domain-containing protein [Synergistaceae bacterium]|nr:FIST C-terminal domain-containing protein [Synergistaceae bacterium]
MLKSTTVITFELDDIEACASELAKETAKNLTLMSGSFALLLCDSDVRHNDLVDGLKRRLGIPIVGFSSTAMMSGADGILDAAAVLTTVTSDDVRFSVAASEPLRAENVCEQIEATYGRALSSLEGPPALIMAFPPCILGITLDAYPRELGRISGGVPVFGGLPAHDDANGSSAVYCGDFASNDRLALLLVSGAVKPVMSVRNSLSMMADLKRTVTSSRGNVIRRVGDGTFVEFLEQFGLDVKKIADAEDSNVSFSSYPLLIERANAPDDDGVLMVRSIFGVDMESGAGTAIGEVPEGSTLSLGVLRMQDIEISTKDTALGLIEKMERNCEDGYSYSVIFAISCVARYFVMAGKSGLEADMLREMLPLGPSLSGFYSFGEICPTSVGGHGAMNAAHNESLVLLAM